MTDLNQETNKKVKAANIRVAVRIRPPIDVELKHNTFEKLLVNSGSKSVSAYNERTNSYKNAEFDIVMDQNSSQRGVFEQAGMHEIVKHVADGYHATVFAYGQTGSGKTYTMEGYKYRSYGDGKPPQAIFEEASSENEGIVPRAIRLLFEMIKQQSNLQKKKFTVYCSYLQVYKEKIYDLLNKSHVKGVVSDGPGLKLKWNKNDVFSVENLYTFECKSIEDVLALYHFGIKNKVIASHNMNNSSSRSHSMLSLTVEQVEISNIDNVVVSKLQMVDLAGSERQSQTGNVANKESIDINKSLFTLRQVISALTDKHENNNYVPYRDSKLTCLLRQSLGGNSFCLMIACLNPCDAQIEENLSTMQYASQASYISNRPVRNDDPKARQIEFLKGEVKRLTEELSKANDTIDFQSKLIKANQAQLQANISLNNQMLAHQEAQSSTGEAQIKTQLSGRNSRDGSLIEHRQIVTQRIVKDQEKVDQYFREKADQIKNIASFQRQQNPMQPHSAANESKDAITERIVHTLNMMKEVLQGNLSLRATIQKQSEQIDDKNAEYFQLQQENEDLRERLNVLEEYTGKDSLVEVQKLVREKRQLENRVKHLEQTSNNWTQFQKTREHFNKRNQKVMSQDKKKATLEEFNDDFEPVRPMMKDDETEHSFYEDNSYTAPRRNMANFQKSSSSVHRPSAFDVQQKEFRLKTNQNQRNLNILNRQRSSHQPNQAYQNLPASSSKAKFLKAPLPNANQTDRIKAPPQQMGPQKIARAKTGKFVSQPLKSTKASQQPYMSRAQRQILESSAELVAHSMNNQLQDYPISLHHSRVDMHNSLDNMYSAGYYYDDIGNHHMIGGSNTQNAWIKQNPITVLENKDDEPKRPFMHDDRLATPEHNMLLSPSTADDNYRVQQSNQYQRMPIRSSQASRQVLDHNQLFENRPVNGLAAESFDNQQQDLR